jgi:hypothetical protein
MEGLVDMFEPLYKGRTINTHIDGLDVKKTMIYRSVEEVTITL